MYQSFDTYPFALPTIPDMSLLALGQQYDWYQSDASDMFSAQAEQTWCTTESIESSSSLSDAFKPSSALARLSPLSEPEVQSPMTVDGSADLPSPGESKSRPKSSGVIRHKRQTDTLPSGTYPYTRPEAKKDVDGVRRRKVWDHVLERRLFTPEELYVLFRP